MVGTPCRITAEAGQQVVLGIAGERESGRDDTAVAVGILALLEPDGDGMHQLRVHPRVTVRGHSQVPAVDQVVGGQLLAYSSFGVSPKDRCALPPRGSWVATDLMASRAAVSAEPVGSAPSMSPSKRSPTSSIVAPSMSGTVQRFS